MNINSWQCGVFVALLSAGTVTGEMVKGGSSTGLLGGRANPPLDETSSVDSHQSGSITAVGTAQVLENDSKPKAIADTSPSPDGDVIATNREPKPVSQSNSYSRSSNFESVANEEASSASMFDRVEKAIDQNLWWVNVPTDPDQISVSAGAFDRDSNPLENDIWLRSIESHDFTNPEFSFANIAVSPSSTTIRADSSTVNEGFPEVSKLPDSNDYRIGALALNPDAIRFDLSDAGRTELESSNRSDLTALAASDIRSEPIPEPSSMIFLGVVVAGIIYASRRSRRNTH